MNEELIIVSIEKRFVTGALRGMSVSESIPFASLNSANQYKEWAMSHKTRPVKPCAGSSGYVFESVYLDKVQSCS